MAKTYLQDTTGELQRCTDFVLKKYKKDFALLEHLRFLFLWRHGSPKYDDESRPLAAWTKLCPTRERDVYGKDVEICVHYNNWHDSTKARKTQLIFHELLHVRVVTDENFAIVKDDDGRIKVEINPHDIVIKGFSREIELFGLHSEYVRTVKDLQQKVRRDG